MASFKPPRAVLVTRPIEYELLLRRHATRAQAAFFLETRGQQLGSVEARHRRFETARERVLSAIPTNWRRSAVAREDLDRFVFEPDDIILALGQDGLVANTAKYLTGQPVIGLNPDPEQYDGVLVLHSPEHASRLLRAAASRRAPLEQRTMVRAVLDNGQSLLALNELFVGHRSHQSARYRIRFGERRERHSSSGLIVTTGTGATGWACSICRERRRGVELPGPTEARLAFLVREAFPSVATGTALTCGVVDGRSPLEITSEMNEGGVLFGDGLEDDRIEFRWGMRAQLSVAETRLCLVARATARDRSAA